MGYVDFSRMVASSCHMPEEYSGLVKCASYLCAIPKVMREVIAMLYSNPIFLGHL